MDSTYKQYKKDTEEALKWLDETRKRQFPAIPDGGVEQYLATAQACKNAAITMPSAVTYCLRSALNTRRIFADWYTSNASDIKIDAKHQYFNENLSQILKLVGAQEPRKDHRAQSSAKVTSSITNRFSGLQVQDTSESEQQSSTGETRPESPQPADYQLRFVELQLRDDHLFPMWCLFLDVAKIRTYILNVWEDYKNGKAEITTAYNMTIFAISKVDELDNNFGQALPDYQTLVSKQNYINCALNHQSSGQWSIRTPKGFDEAAFHAAMDEHAKSVAKRIEVPRERESFLMRPEFVLLSTVFGKGPSGVEAGHLSELDSVYAHLQEDLTHLVWLQDVTAKQDVTGKQSLHNDVVSRILKLCRDCVPANLANCFILAIHRSLYRDAAIACLLQRDMESAARGSADIIHTRTEDLIQFVRGLKAKANNTTIGTSPLLMAEVTNALIVMKAEFEMSTISMYPTTIRSCYLYCTTQKKASKSQFAIPDMETIIGLQTKSIFASNTIDTIDHKAIRRRFWSTEGVPPSTFKSNSKTHELTKLAQGKKCVYEWILDKLTKKDGFDEQTVVDVFGDSEYRKNRNRPGWRSELHLPPVTEILWFKDERDQKDWIKPAKKVISDELILSFGPGQDIKGDITEVLACVERLLAREAPVLFYEYVRHLQQLSRTSMWDISAEEVDSYIIRKKGKTWQMSQPDVLTQALEAKCREFRCRQGNLKCADLLSSRLEKSGLEADTYRRDQGQVPCILQTQLKVVKYTPLK